jgi:hypothetical protein
MDTRLQIPLKAIVIIFICSCFAALLCFKFLESTATYQDSTGIKVTGAIVGLLVTFLVLWRSFRTFTKELEQMELEKLKEQVKNLQNQLLRQHPAPPRYRRVINEDYKVVFHIPEAWTLGGGFMSIYAPQHEERTMFLDNIVFERKPVLLFYREIQHKKKVAMLVQEFRDLEDPEFLRKKEELGRTFFGHLDDPRGDNEKIDNIIDLISESISGTTLGTPEYTEVDGYPAIRCQISNPLFPNLVNLFTYVHINVGDEYVYTITLTAMSSRVGDYSTVYNKVLNSLKFIT